MTEALRVADFDYGLAQERIAQEPLRQRDASRLLHVTGAGAFEDHGFGDLPGLVRPGDLLVANETRVRRARLRGIDYRGGAVELLVLEQVDGGTYSCIGRPARRLRPGAEVAVHPGLTCMVLAVRDDGTRLVSVRCDGDAGAAIDAAGEAPLPPYIRRRLDDAERYQTVYAGADAVSAAAPTAGLHFTPRVIDAVRARGAGWATLRLDVGLGTFAPMRCDAVADHVMHRERYLLPGAAAAAIAATRARGGRVIAVGTTVVRVLESCATGDGAVRAAGGTTDLFIRPGHRFAAVDGLLTNFHQPRSSLLVLVAAFIGMERWRAAYAHAMAHGYRFLSFGDCMLCWRGDAV